MTIDAVRVMRETALARVEHHPTLASTNDRAAQCAGHKAIEMPLLVVADEQTAGRGRGGKRWWSSSDSLMFSLLVDAATVAAGEDRSPLVALAAAVAVVDSIASLLPTHQVGIHWPNDVYVCVNDSQENSPVSTPRHCGGGGGDPTLPPPATAVAGRFDDGTAPLQSKEHRQRTIARKLAGILVEVLANRRHVIGIGLNVNSTLADAPPELRATVATLRDLSGHEHDRTTLLIDLVQRLDAAFSQLREAPKDVATRADSLCLQRGQTLTLAWSDRKVTGVCRGIAADGGILLETPGGVETFLSGSAERTDAVLSR